MKASEFFIKEHPTPIQDLEGADIEVWNHLELFSMREMIDFAESYNNYLKSI